MKSTSFMKAAALALALSGCVEGGSPHDISYVWFGHQRSMRVEADRIWGSTTELDRVEPNTFRGWYFGLTAELRFEGDRVKGWLGGRPIDLHVEETDGVLKVWGLVGGRLLGRLQLSADGLERLNARCGVGLGRGGGGVGRCAVPAALKLPDGWSRLETNQRAMVLALLFAN